MFKDVNTVAETLYEAYADAHLEQFDCECDPWEAIGPEERAGWVAAAEKALEL